jgi:L-alanine-DL-glutamate epimerase-like enolase superfamily enzyme
MLDESIVGLEDLEMASEMGIKFIKLKLFKRGGIRELVELSGFTNRVGIMAIPGNGVSTRLSKSIEIQVSNKYWKFFQTVCKAQVS